MADKQADRLGMRAGVVTGMALLGAVVTGLAVGADKSADPAASQAAAVDPATKAHWDTLQHYCGDCHNSQDWAGGVAFDTMSPGEIPKDAKVWEAVVKRMEGGFMPPPGKPHPDAKTVDGITGWLTHTLDNAETTPVPGRVPFRRLNRREYSNAVRDLLALDIDAASLLPTDEHPKNGFDTDAASLGVSPAFLDQYVNAARVVAEEAVGNPKAPATTTTYGQLADMVISLQVFGRYGEGDQQLYRDGMPFGTRGGMSAEHVFPADGDYQLTIGDLALGRDVPLMEFDNTVVALLDGKEIFRTHIGGDADQKSIDQTQQVGVDAINKRLRNISFHATQGQHTIAVTLLHRDYAESDDRTRGRMLEGGQERVQQIHAFQVKGPLKITGMTDSATRRKVFICHPAQAADEDACAQRIVANLARLAFRRPVTDEDLHPLMAFYARGKKEAGFEAGVRDALSGILGSPYFLYRVESEAPGARSGSLPAGSLDDLSLASRLSFFMWSSIPDDELLRTAEAGKLHEPDELKREVHRMLADPRARSLTDDFAFQWLNMAKLDEIVPDRGEFSYAAGPVDPRPLFKEELSRFVDSVFRSNQPLTALLTADYTYLNEPLAMLYGMEDVKGGEFRKVQLTDSRRFGLLGKGAVLMATANPNRTAPVLRGAWILERVIGVPAPSPPPNVPTLKENVRGKPATTVRERVMQHSVQPNCHACHGVMDPLGFALENFNTVGQFRTYDPDTHTLLDTKGVLPDGTVMNGPDDLRKVLVQRQDLFLQTLTEELLSYGLGRPLDYYDMPVVRDIQRKVAKQGDRFEDLVDEVVSTDAFRRRAAAPAAAGTPATKTASTLAPAAAITPTGGN